MPLKILRRASLLALPLVLTACALGPQLAPAGDFATKDYAVKLNSDWNAIPIRTDKGNKATILTKDGPNLNAVYLLADLKEGDAIINEVRRDQPVPKFSADMFELELIEFLVDSLEKGGGYTGIETDNVRPALFDGNEGVRFDFTGRTSAGLDVEGQAMMAVEDGTLDVIFFIAPSEFYAARYRSDVDAIFASVADE